MADEVVEQTNTTEEVGMQETETSFTDEGVRERLDDLEPELREHLAAVGAKLGDVESMADLLLNLTLGDPKTAQRVKDAKRGAEKARSYLPAGKGFDTYDAQRATAYAAVSIAESLVVLMESAAKAKR